MESFLVNYFRKQGQTKHIVKRLFVEIFFAIYILILYVPLKILQGIYWLIEKATGIKY